MKGIRSAEIVPSTAAPWPDLAGGGDFNEPDLHRAREKDRKQEEGLANSKVGSELRRQLGDVAIRKESERGGAAKTDGFITLSRSTAES